jgi:hypothetical protein
VCVCVAVDCCVVAVSVVSIEAPIQYCIRARRASREKSVYRRVPCIQFRFVIETEVEHSLQHARQHVHQSHHPTGQRT